MKKPEAITFLPVPPTEDKFDREYHIIADGTRKVGRVFSTLAPKSGNPWWTAETNNHAVGTRHEERWAAFLEVFGPRMGLGDRDHDYTELRKKGIELFQAVKSARS